MTDTLLYNPPNIDPAQRTSIMGTIQFVIDNLVMQEIDKMMPCQVIAVNRTTNRVSVQITVNKVSTAGQNVIRAQIPSIPIYSPSAGGFVINFPVQPGDLGWIKAADADISMFLQTLKQSPPNTNLMHQFDSSVFYPDNMNQTVTIASEDAGNLVLQNYAGTTRVAIWPNQVKVTSPTVLVSCANAEVNASASAEITAPVSSITSSTSITLDSPEIILNGAISQTGGGGAEFSGSITATGEVTAMSTIPLSTHLHTGVTTGSGDTGTPIP